MRDGELEAIDPELEALLARERPVPPASPRLKARLGRRLEGTLRLGGQLALGKALVAAAVLLMAAAAVLVVGRAIRQAPATGGPGIATTPAPLRDPTTAMRPVVAPSSPGGPARQEPVEESDRRPRAAWFGQRDVAVRRVAGRVLFGGAPVHGAAITLESPASAADAALVLRATTDEGGRFSLAPEAAWSYALVATAPDRTAAVRRIDLRDPTLDVERIDLVLTPCVAAIAGTVADVGGGPIAGAKVRLLDGPSSGPATVSDDRGHYEICAAVGDAHLRVGGEGYGERRLEVRVAGRTRLDVALEPEAVFSGRALDPSGRPAPDIQVNLWPASGDAAAASTLTSRDGRFELRGLGGGRFHLNAWGGELMASTEVTISGGARQASDVILEESAVIRGVLLRQGLPFAGALIRAVGAEGFASFAARSQVDGSFVIHGARRGEVHFTVDDKPTFRPESLRVERLLVEGVLLEIP